MPSWLTDLTLGQIAIVVGGVVAVLGLFTKVWKTVRPVWRGVRDFLDDWRGEPARDVAGMKPQLSAIDHEMHPNSGSSLRDQVDNITTTLNEHIAHQQG